jgi:EmrB/QacA subfamily drug resistance transporter
MEKPAAKNVSKKAVLLVSALSSFVAPFLIVGVNIALPAISKEFGMNAVEMNWVATIYLLVSAMLLVPFGRLADIYGRKRIFIIGIITTGLASILCMISNTGTMLIVFRALQGLGAGMVFGTANALITSVYPANERGGALGINAAAVYIGLSVSPLISGFLTQHLGWRSVFLLATLLGLLILIIVLWKLKDEWAECRGEKFDYPGSITFSLSLLTIMYGLSILPNNSGIWLILAGIAGLIVFVFLETKIKFPVLNINIFRNNISFGLSNLASLIAYNSTFAVGFLLSLYLQYIKGFDPGYSGLILMAQPIFMVIFSPLAGKLSDKIQPRIVASIGLAISTAGVFMLGYLGNDSGLAYILTSLIIIGIGFGLFSSPNTNAVMSSVEKKYYGVASGILGTTRLFGQTLSLGVVLLIFALNIGPVQITPDSYPLFLKSMQIIFLISAISGLFAIIASIARGKTIR